MNLSCPKCNSFEVYPSGVKNVLDFVLKGLWVRAFRCHCCGDRFHTFTTRKDRRALNERIVMRMAMRQLVSRVSM